MAFTNSCYPRSVSSHGKRQMTIEEFKKWLKQFDNDGDGLISKEELREALRSVGGWFTTWNSGRAIKSADANSNGYIDDTEIKHLISFAEKHFGVKIVMS
ncbi:hypothetical protein FRX31_018352 [Thalictrum thalictroides]|uniref:EF-hand domain-containing protein n=1 Tax=Thalictrum thalictroides TaxID=46969 RepID=A0A7J6W4R7_THATH|nr:hypothetical protein FRX31_018352 [Thalictrum thalictroides]